MLKFHFSREKRAFCLIVHEPNWLHFGLSLFGLWWAFSLPWQLAVVLYYEPQAWPLVLYNVALFLLVLIACSARERRAAKAAAPARRRPSAR